MRESDLAYLLDRSVANLRRLLSGIPPIRHRGEVRFRWEAVLPRLEREHLRHALANAATRPVRGISRRWVGGYPHLVAEWHPSKNGTMMPWEVSYGSSRSIWWKCPAGPDHEWQAKARRRVLGDGCPFCANQRVSVTNSLARHAPATAREWHPTRNQPLTPNDVVVGSARIVWWKCPAGPDHEWRARVLNRTVLGSRCPCCSGRRFSVTNSLAAVAPELAAQWHRSRNGRLRPTGLLAYSTRLVWWQCPVARDHVWRERPSVRLSHQRGCPCCAGKRVVRSNSLASREPDVAREWHPTRNGALTPGDVTARSPRVVWWRCRDDASHEWRAAILNRTRRHIRSGSGCPFCFRARRSLGRH